MCFCVHVCVFKVYMHALCWWQLRIRNLCVDCRLIVCEGDVDSVSLWWLHTVRVCVCECVCYCHVCGCWLQSNADQMKQEIGILAPSIISVLLPSPPVCSSLHLWFIHFISISLPVFLYFLSLKLSHDRPLSFHTCFSSSFEIASRLPRFHAAMPHKNRWHFFFFTFSAFSLGGKHQEWLN